MYKPPLPLPWTVTLLKTMRSWLATAGKWHQLPPNFSLLRTATRLKENCSPLQHCSSCGKNHLQGFIKDRLQGFIKNRLQGFSTRLTMFKMWAQDDGRRMQSSDHWDQVFSAFYTESFKKTKMRRILVYDCLVINDFKLYLGNTSLKTVNVQICFAFSKSWLDGLSEKSLRLKYCWKMLTILQK